MFKYKRILVLIVFMIILSGCEANVTLNIDKNNNVNQTIKISQDNSILGNVGQNYSEYINDALDYNSAKNIDYNRKDFHDDEKFGTIFTKKNTNICSELKSSYFSSFFYEMDCDETDSYYNVSAKTSYTYCPSDSSYCSDVEKVTITINLPEKAIFDDADMVEGNKYTWIYDRQEEGTLTLKFKKYKVNDILNSNNKDLASVLGVVIIIIFVISIAVFVLFKKYKKNRIEY